MKRVDAFKRFIIIFELHIGLNSAKHKQQFLILSRYFIQSFY